MAFKPVGEPGHLAATAFLRRQINFHLICLKITNNADPLARFGFLFSEMWGTEAAAGNCLSEIRRGTLPAQSDAPLIVVNNCMFLGLSTSVIFKLLVSEPATPEGLALEKTPVKHSPEARIPHFVLILSQDDR